jgi:histidinol phosphatase-like enzyme
MFLRARDELGLSLADSVMIGDKPSDVAAARRAGVGRSFLIRSEPTDLDTLADGVFDDLVDCANQLLA